MKIYKGVITEFVYADALVPNQAICDTETRNVQRSTL